ncbi:MAG: preprotein translocase subunit YajC [Christensenellales bacterium]|jgi:preprotein translocase subunit YajC
MTKFMITVLLEAATASTGATSNSIGTLLLQVLPLVAIVVVFYFLLIRPQQKKQKALNKLLAELKVGDNVKTIGGFYGTITRVKDDTVTIAMGPQKVELVIERRAISNVESPDVESDAK